MEKRLEPKLRFKEFSDEWKESAYPEVINKANQGVNTTTEKVSYSENGYTVIRSNNVLTNKINLNDVKYVDEDTFNRISDNCKPKNGDILYCNIGSALGSASLYSGDDKVLINWNVFRIQPNRKIINNFFFSQYLNLKKNYMLRFATQSTMPFISGKAFNKLKVFYPPLPEQEKIASFLSSVDSKIEKLEKKRELLSQYKKGIMQKIFSQEIRFSDKNGNDYPQWEEKKLGEICDVRDGTHDSPKYVEKGFPMITSKNLLKNGTIDYDNVNYLTLKDYDEINKRSKVHKGDILFGMIGTIGNPVIVDKEGFAIKNVALIKEKTELKNEYLIQFLNSSHISRQFYVLNAGGTQKFIALGVIRGLYIKTPCLEEQKKIADFLSSIDKKIELVERETEKNKKFKKGLLQQMFV